MTALASHGDLDAMYVLGMAHYDGDDGVEFDRDQCVNLLERAAGQGHVKAAHDLGCFRYFGYGFPAEFRDLAKAAELLATSAAAGYSPSMTFLGSMYENGEGVEKCMRRARTLYQAAADAGDELGLKQLARTGGA